ncbi:uncharacterized protein LOC18423183 [Amborella trichopoda]|uniref:uncharacterized protein LOC18423183 n=1 Tax=Amborella trichopoda TaxID=13333 RepID=UPI0009C19903|nr:uncharacterized protein LOC18423183 [Amborella trichopoda]|eukprot:XP_020528193.1 uncharacterized protein LOC18423183 [Amborella trichopoda]
MAAVDWYGPLIDLKDAGSHIGSYVQLLVFVHMCRPPQMIKALYGRRLMRIVVQVGDNTCPYFTVSLWQKQMGSTVSAGDIVLLQNFRISEFCGIVEALTIQYSSLMHLVHSQELVAAKDVEEVVACCRFGGPTKDKMKLVVQWARQTQATLLRNLNHMHLCPVMEVGVSNGRQLKNWKLSAKSKSRECLSISEVSFLRESCSVSFYGNIGEIFLPCNSKPASEFRREKLFIGKRLFVMADDKIGDDLICSGCKYCGSPMKLSSLAEHDPAQLYCEKSSNHLHTVGQIYTPFLLYVWDQSTYIPILVKNMAAELLFCNISAEKVSLSFDQYQKPMSICNPHLAKNSTQGSASCNGSNLYRIWLILLKMLLRQGKNSPFKFEVLVHCSKDQGDDKFELISFSAHKRMQ